MLQAVRIHIPAAVTQPAESPGADSMHAAEVHAPVAVIQPSETHTYTVDETAVLSFTTTSDSTGAIVKPTQEASGTCDMSAEMATTIVERTQQTAARRLKSSLGADELTFGTRADTGDNGRSMWRDPTLELTFTGACPLVSESARIAAET